MKICLTGSHGTGKTTLMKELQNFLPYYDIQIESLTRKAVGDASKVNFGTVDESERLIAEAYMNSFLNASKNFIASRHMLDVLAYSLYLNKKNKNIDLLTIEDIENKIEQIIREKIFDLVFYIPIEFALPDVALGEEFREGQSDLNYQKEVDLIIQYLLWKYDIPYIKLTGNLNQRIEQFLREIENNS